MNDQSTFPTPLIKSARGNTLFSRDIRDQFTVQVKIWDDAAIRQRYFVRLIGTGVDDTSQIDELVLTDKLTKTELDSGMLELLLPKTLFEGLTDKYYFSIRFAVNFQGDGPESDATLFPWARFRLVKDLYKDLTDFADGKMNGWQRGTGLEPTDRLAIVTLEGKACLQCDIDVKSKGQTIIYKDFDLIEGRKYYFDVSMRVDAATPPKWIIVYLQEGKRYEGWTFKEQQTFLPIGRGFKADSPRLRLEISTDLVREGGRRSFYLTDMLLYEMPAARDWDPEWEKEYDGVERPEPKEPE